MAVTETSNNPAIPAVTGESTASGTGVTGIVSGSGGSGVWGQTTNGRAVVGADLGATGVGVWGETTGGDGVVGVVNQGNGSAVHGVKRGAGGWAGDFEGNVNITGVLTLLNIPNIEGMTLGQLIDNQLLATGAVQENVYLKQKLSELNNSLSLLEARISSLGG